MDVQTQTIVDDYAVRFYRWSLQDSAREFSERFKKIRRITSEPVRRFIEFAEGLPLPQQRSLSKALVKRFHPRAIQLTKDFLDATEESLVQTFLDATEPCGRDKNSAAGLIVGQRDLRKALKGALVSRLGEPDPTWANPAEWRFLHTVHGWTVFTYVDLGGRIHHLTYSHCIRAGKSSLIEHTSILYWMGVMSQTSWEIMSSSQTEEVADSLVDLCTHFLDATHQLLAGLDPPLNA